MYNFFEGGLALIVICSDLTSAVIKMVFDYFFIFLQMGRKTMLSAGFKTKINQQRPAGRSVCLLREKK